MRFSESAARGLFSGRHRPSLVCAAATPNASPQAQGQDQDNTQSQNLDVAYPTTFYPGVTDQDAATPIPIKGGDRLEADITLAAQPAMRLRLSAAPGDMGRGVSVALNQTIFGQVEAQPARVVFNSNGPVEVEGVLPGHYDVTISHFVPGQGEGATKHFSSRRRLRHDRAFRGQRSRCHHRHRQSSSMAGKLPGTAGISLRTPNSRRQQYAPLNEAGEFTVEVSPGTYEVVGNINGMHIVSLKATGGQLAGRMLTVKSRRHSKAGDRRRNRPRRDRRHRPAARGNRPAA